MERQHFQFYDPVPTLAPPNDDLELQLVWLHLVEHCNGTLTPSDFAQAWLSHIHYMWDEYGRCRWNLRRGLPAELTGAFENPFASGMGSPIRSEIWAALFPGDSVSAARYAALDASLDHGVEGIAGEVLFAAMQSAVAIGSSLSDALTLALHFLPPHLETKSAITLVLDCHASGAPEWSCWETLLAHHGNENFTHGPLNVALTIWALLYGKGDFTKSLLLAVNGGYDTDCTAATVGATLGLHFGADHIPRDWADPIGEDIYVGPGIVGIRSPETLSELTERTLALQGRLKPLPWDPAIWVSSPPARDLVSLKGTIFIRPLHSDAVLAWANGELPEEVKQAGGATWIWHKASEDLRELVCLARAGARLFLDGTQILACPAGLPYVPATHRCAPEARIRIQVPSGSHEIRLELGQAEQVQDACILLAYPNLHLAPWSKDELPHLASLPDTDSPPPD